MPTQNTRIDLGGTKEPQASFVLYEKIIADRGSLYSVSFGRVSNREEMQQFLKTLKRKKKYAKATHNTWAARVKKDEAIFETKNDDGETGAGMVILRVMQAKNVANCIICVTRWFGGVKLMGDRFKHVQNATKYAIKHIHDHKQPNQRAGEA
jgi:putative IMPACT (imprinted ancient) family translation regulator